MKKEIIINSTAAETRIAIVEDGRLVEIFVERPEKERMVGDIHKGRVAKVLPGMKAAFVNVGMKQDAFLHFSDIGDNTHEYTGLADADDSEDMEVSPESEIRHFRVHHHSSGGRFLRTGQEILVQVIKEPIYNKGARVTSEISIPGRFTVLIPNDPSQMIGVSRKITSVSERRRLKKLAKELKPAGYGIIIRTNAENKDDEILRHDILTALETWKGVDRKAKSISAPAIVYKDMEMVSSIIRDLFSNDVSRVLIDDRRLHKAISNYISTTTPHLLDRIEHYKESKPLFDLYGIEQDIQASTEKRVPLRNGGYIIIEHTEALISVDVNSGKFMGRGSYEDNSMAVNMIAAREVTRQLRLRDIGGLIVIDFIDLRDERNKRKLLEEMKRELRKDRAKFSILPMDEYGLIELTRERIRPSIMFSLSEPCPACAGTGRVGNRTTLFNKIDRWIRRYKKDHPLPSRLLFAIHPDVEDVLALRISRLKWRYFIFGKLEPVDEMRMDEFRVFNSKDEDITETYLA
ncbi:MAG: Rne/Rng family ribonuclease [Bacteroidetes bacterium]|nr:Rne/Rng family ribonuclease [Bacteroidota bacterium]